MKYVGVVTVAIIAASLSTSLAAGDWYLKNGQLVCTTQSAYREQVQYLSHGVQGAVPGCGVTEKRYRVVPLDINIVAPSRVRIIDRRANVWVDAGSAIEMIRE